MNFITWIQRPGSAGHFFALASGALLPFSFAPYDLWPVQFLSLALFYFSLPKLTTKQAMWRGWWFGLGAYAAGVSWVYVSIHVHSQTPAVPAFFMTLFFVAGLAWFFAAMTWAFQKLFYDHEYRFLAFACFWVLCEWTRSWLFTGFPWLYVGDAHINTWLAGYAPVLGVYGIGFLVALMAAYLMDAILKIAEKNPDEIKALFTKETFSKEQLKKNAPLPIAILLAPWLLGGLLNLVSWTSPAENGEIDVVAIQGNIPQDRKWLPEEIYPTLEKYRSASEKNWDANIILWPETAITVLHHQAKEYLKFLNEEGQKNETALITGIPYQQSKEEPFPGAFHNTILALGEGDGLYHKQKLVPFGEYMPLPQFMRSWLAFFNIPMSDFVAGSSEQQLLNIKHGDLEYSIAPYICYDIVYPDFAANLAKDSGFMVTISNDAWFGASIGPLQHLGIARMRALENGRFLLRSTNTGVTALIDNKGNIVEQIPQFEYGVLKAKAQVMTGNTPFNVLGSWPILLMVFACLLLMTLVSQRKQVQTS